MKWLIFMGGGGGGETQSYGQSYAQEGKSQGATSLYTPLVEECSNLNMSLLWTTFVLYVSMYVHCHLLHPV